MAHSFKAGDRVKLAAHSLQYVRDVLRTEAGSGPYLIHSIDGLGSNVSVIGVQGSVSRNWHPAHFVSAATPVAADPGAAVVKTFIVAVLKEGRPAPSEAPKVYSSRLQAETVSRIMAEKHIGETFVVFEAVAASCLPRKSAVTVNL